MSSVLVSMAVVKINRMSYLTPHRVECSPMDEDGQINSMSPFTPYCVECCYIDDVGKADPQILSHPTVSSVITNTPGNFDII